MNRFENSVATRADVLFAHAAYGISAVILVTLFVENFVLSSGFDILRFREIDDVAFQETLRRVHLAIEAGQFRHLFVINDYAYGWVFWFPLALVTYPLYLVSTHFAIDWPLIVAPRQISLAFGIATLLLMRKIFKKYGMPEWIAAAGFLVFLLFPSFGYTSLRFGTVNEVMFFSVLSLYLAVAENHSTLRGRLFAAAALALAGGVKLSGLLISPLIVALIALRYEFKSFSVLARDLMLSTALFVVLLIAFSSPYLFAYPFQPQYGQEYFKTLSYFIGVTKLATGPLEPFERFYSVFFGSVANAICMSILFFGLLMHALKSKADRLDALASIGVLLLIVAYLFYSVKNGNSAALYLTSISFLLLFGLLYFSGLRGGKIILIVIISLELMDLTHRAWLQYEIASASWNHLAYYIKGVKSIHDIDESSLISDCIGAKDKNWGSHLFVDHTVPTGFNSLHYPKACISVAWNNLSPDGKYCDRKIDYIVMDKLAPGSLPGDLFDSMVKTADPKIASDLLVDRESRKTIANGDHFDGRHFVKTCDLDTVQVYAAERVK
jgi:hypothetical protein